tara:strand:+ start:217 stop:354 length:138 start_codon:yes stop_codon:yes gene_type:complete
MKFEAKERKCNKCGEPAKFYYKEWWCGHTKDLKGVCIKPKNERKK